ncbi:hypothetical protein BpHYR1_000581 [Brachionus plicatilis]|uniref:Uncharacterized protein n=1 Tax=Brachionus plicatilis TaxID=10195 RepID=A0A3M7T4F8_BRAPC|nr:hypothetical protein BpHYR1_000581 [Brachionus plicatilis]
MSTPTTMVSLSVELSSLNRLEFNKRFWLPSCIGKLVELAMALLVITTDKITAMEITTTRTSPMIASALSLKLFLNLADLWLKRFLS